jgi:hypothetical protein
MSTRVRWIVVGVAALAVVELVLLYPRVGVWAVPVALLIGLLAWLVVSSRPRVAQPLDLHCSFCGQSHREVKKLIPGPGVNICDECIDLCNEIIEEEASVTGWPWRRVAPPSDEG